MKVVYDGPQPSRTVEVGGGKQITVERGKSCDVPKEIGEQLVKQRHYSTGGAGKDASAKKGE